MKNILTILLLGTLSNIFAQNDKFTRAEIDTILAFDEGSALSKVDTVRNVIQFRTPTFILLAIKNFDYRVDLDMRFDVVKVDGQICLESLNLYQKVSREGVYRYDKVVFQVGTKKEIKMGTNSTHEFYNTMNSDGSGEIKGDELVALFKESIDNYKNIQANYIIRSMNRTTTRTIIATKIRANFGGILEIYTELQKIYSNCKTKLFSIDETAGNATVASDNCESILMKYDSWEEDSTYFSSATDQVILMKHITPKGTYHTVKLTGFGQTINVDGKGLTILLEDGSKIISQIAEIKVDPISNGYTYSSQKKLTDQELAFLLKYPVVSFKLYNKTTLIEEKDAAEFLKLFNCVAN